MIRRGLRRIRRWLVPPKPRPLILMYHRIADEPIDPWGLAVSPSHLAEQIEVLRRSRYPLPLADFLRDWHAGTLRDDAVSVTFDDGYADNLFAGKPRLAAADVPATAFLATGYLGRSEEFWWDELARLILTGGNLGNAYIVVRGKRLDVDLAGEPPLQATGSWRALLHPAQTRRQAAYIAIWQALRPLPEQERAGAMAELRALGSGGPPSNKGRAMTADEVRAFAGDGLVTLGAHSVTHPLLAELDAATLGEEIAESKRACEALARKPVTAFAYPYGNFDAAVRAKVADAGFTSAYSTIHGPVTSASDPLALPRIQVLDWNGDAFERALRSADG